MKEIDKIALVFIQNNRLLVARSKGQDNYYIPGGKRDIGETDQKALIREIKEEISVDIIPSSITYLETFKAQAHNKEDGVLVKITCYLAEFTGVIQAAAEIEEVNFLTYQEKQKCSSVTILIMDWLQSKGMLS